VARQPKQRAIGRRDVRAYLEAQTADILVDLLLDAAERDARTWDRLALAAASEGSRAQRLATLRLSVDRAVATLDDVRWDEMWDYTTGIEEAVDGIERVLRDGHAADAVDASEHALAAVEEAMQHVDDSGGQMGAVLERLQGIHLRACRAAKPDPVALAERLYEWECSGDWDTFSGAARIYSRVLGAAGRARYRELAEAEWSQLPALGPGEPGYAGRRYALTRVMEELARNVDELVDVIAHNLSSGHQFLRIAESYRDADRSDEAVVWAERGLAAFANAPDGRLADFLADERARRGEHHEAARLMWEAYARHPCLATYRRLRLHAVPAGDWPERRQRALVFLQAQLTRRGAAHTARRHPAWHTADRSELVRILLWDDDPEAAWSEAQAGGCEHGLWLKLAEQRRADHPEDALAVYQARVDPTIARAKNDAYQEATRYVVEVRGLLAALGREGEFASYLADLRVRHGRKRNLMKLLDALP